MLPASAVPVIVGVASLVLEEVVRDDGALSAVVSTVIDKAEEEGEVLPETSVAVAVNEYVPSLKVDNVIEKSPLLAAIAEPKLVLRLSPIKP